MLLSSISMISNRLEETREHAKEESHYSSQPLSLDKEMAEGESERARESRQEEESAEKQRLSYIRNALSLSLTG